MDHQKLPSSFVDMQLASITAFNIRFAHHIIKIEENLHLFVTVMEEPKENIDTITAQREKRIRLEFSRRFTRDYLYPIQLKIKEVENEYLTFLSNENCKIAQSMILRPLVLTLMKKLSSSTQVREAYLQFLNNNKSKIFVKLNEVLNMITHSFEIIKSIVDHKILNDTEIENLCMVISNINSNQKQFLMHKACNSERRIGKKSKVKEHIEKPATNNDQFIESKKEETDINEVNKKPTCDIHQLKNVSFSHIVYSPRTKKITDVNSCGGSKNTNTDISFMLHSSVSEFSSRISDLILNELVVELVNDISETLKKLALHAFDEEFNDSY